MKHANKAEGPSVCPNITMQNKHLHTELKQEHTKSVIRSILINVTGTQTRYILERTKTNSLKTEEQIRFNSMTSQDTGSNVVFCEYKNV
jgi:hypothetical protein